MFDLKNKMASIAQKVLSLQPKAIDSTKCTPNKSLYQQILNNSQATSERQAKQFNLGNTHCTSNPIDAADFILEREYGDSSLWAVAVRLVLAALSFSSADNALR